MNYFCRRISSGGGRSGTAPIDRLSRGASPAPNFSLISRRCLHPDAAATFLFFNLIFYCEQQPCSGVLGRLHPVLYDK